VYCDKTNGYEEKKNVDECLGGILERESWSISVLRKGASNDKLRDRNAD
jgi:hypothetical protein